VATSIEAEQQSRVLQELLRDSPLDGRPDVSR
jgi:hypothetical protein